MTGVVDCALAALDAAAGAAGVTDVVSPALMAALRAISDASDDGDASFQDAALARGLLGKLCGVIRRVQAPDVWGAVGDVCVWEGLPEAARRRIAGAIDVPRVVACMAHPASGTLEVFSCMRCLATLAAHAGPSLVQSGACQTFASVAFRYHYSGSPWSAEIRGAAVMFLHGFLGITDNCEHAPDFFIGGNSLLVTDSRVRAVAGSGLVALALLSLRDGEEQLIHDALRCLRRLFGAVAALRMFGHEIVESDGASALLACARRFPDCEKVALVCLLLFAKATTPEVVPAGTAIRRACAGDAALIVRGVLRVHYSVLAAKVCVFVLQSTQGSAGQSPCVAVDIMAKLLRFGGADARVDGAAAGRAVVFAVTAFRG